MGIFSVVFTIAAVGGLPLLDLFGAAGTFFPSFTAYRYIRWYKKSLPGTNSTSDFGLDFIRWCICPETLKFTTSIYAVDKIRWCACQKCSNSIHLSTLSVISDGGSAQECSNLLHPYMAFSQIRWAVQKSGRRKGKFPSRRLP